MIQVLTPFASGFDLTPLASREQAFNDMIANARKFDGSYEAAKARFDSITNYSPQAECTRLAPRGGLDRGFPPFGKQIARPTFEQDNGKAER